MSSSVQMLTLEVLDTVGAAIGSGVLRTTCESDLTGGHTVEHAHSQCFIHGHSNNTLFIGL